MTKTPYITLDEYWGLKEFEEAKGLEGYRWVKPRDWTKLLLLDPEDTTVAEIHPLVGSGVNRRPGRYYRAVYCTRGNRGNYHDGNSLPQCQLWAVEMVKSQRILRVYAALQHSNLEVF